MTYEWEGMILDREGNRICDIKNIEASTIEIAVKRAFRRYNRAFKIALERDPEMRYRTEGKFQGKSFITEGLYGLTFNLFRTDTARHVGGSFYVSPSLDFSKIAYMKRNYLFGD